jgi:hypothetical protein
MIDILYEQHAKSFFFLGSFALSLATFALCDIAIAA